VGFFLAFALQIRADMEELRVWRPEDVGPDTDDHILEELCARLAAATDVDAARIEVDVRNREVILEGTTRNERMTRAVMMCVIEVPGVRAVRSYLQTSPV
jgi:osmotically-inducible protein OsmY